MYGSKNPLPMSKAFKILCILELIGAIIVTHTLVIPCVRIPSASMEPSISSGSICAVVNDFVVKTYQRRDIVIFLSPDNTTLYCKRIIGLPGDTVEIRNGKTYVNELELSEPYVSSASGSYGPYIVPDGYLLLLGDNRDNSYDARFWDAPYIPVSKLKGRVALIWYNRLEGFCWNSI